MADTFESPMEQAIPSFLAVGVESVLREQFGMERTVTMPTAIAAGVLAAAVQAWIRGYIKKRGSTNDEKVGA